MGRAGPVRRPGPGRRVGSDGGRPLNPWLEDRLVRLASSAGGQPVLDVGCGKGYWLGRMSAWGVPVVGVEHDPARAAVAVTQAPVAMGDAARLPLATGSVGVVWMIHVLHHLPDPPAVLAEVRRVLRPGGHLVLAETVEDNPAIRLGRRFHPHWDGVGVHARFTGATLATLVAAADLFVEEWRQHSLVSFAAWALPVGDRPAWAALDRLEGRLPASWRDRWGAHLELVATAPR
jgi:SAM-dependent methyltransferase